MPESQTHQQTIARNYIATDASRLKRDILDAAPVRRQRLGRHVCEKRGGEAIFFQKSLVSVWLGGLHLDMVGLGLLAWQANAVKERGFEHHVDSRPFPLETYVCHVLVS